jgi:GNAT superfamily N-acetyltransferase
MSAFSLHPITDADRPVVARLTAEQWGSDWMVAHGERFLISQLPGFLARMEDRIVGLITYTIRQNGCEITSLDSFEEGIGIGTALIEAVKKVAVQSGCQRLFLITTNDNTHALRFYQRRGFTLSALHIGAVNESRKIKPEIPLLGNDGIPIRDEIELEFPLARE